MNLEWYDLVAIVFLFTPILPGLIFGSYLMYVITAQRTLLGSVHLLVPWMFGLVCILVSLLCLRVIIQILQIGAQKNLNITPMSYAGWDTARPSKTLSAMSTYRVETVLPAYGMQSSDSRQKREMYLRSKMTKINGELQTVSNLLTTAHSFSTYTITGAVKVNTYNPTTIDLLA